MEKVPLIGNELLAMRGAAGANDNAMMRITHAAHEGVTERELANEAEMFYTQAGAEGFFARIAFGANTAEPYHEPDDTPLREGDAIVVNLGCVLRRCLSTCARTFFWQRISPEQLAAFEAAKHIEEAAFAAGAPGTPARDIVARMRKTAADAGFADNCAPGREFDPEDGYLIPTSLTRLGDGLIEEGLYFAVSPGVYLPGSFGAVMGDSVFIADYGLDVLSRFPRDLAIL